MNSEDLVEVYRASDGVQAHLMASALEDEGIRAFVDDQLQAATEFPQAGRPRRASWCRIPMPPAPRTLLERT